MSRYETGWIKFHRRIVAEDIGSNGVHLAVWTTLLCWATRFESKIRWQGRQRVIPPGSVVTAIRELALRLRFSKDAVARALRKLSERDSIRIESATRGTLITICNWADYQEIGNEGATQNRNECDTRRTQPGHEPDLIGEAENKRKKNSRFDYPDEFERIYESFPRREGKQAGFKVYHREIKTAEDRARLVAAIRNYERAKRGTEPSYLLMFGTFMAQWGDWLDAKTGTANSPSSINTKPIKLEDLT